MTHRVLIEFVVDVPNPGVARDVETRIVREHGARMCETLKSVTGYDPLSAPGRVGLLVAIEPVTWDAAERDWIGPDDNGESDDE